MDLEGESDLDQRAAWLAQIREFGQTPKQVRLRVSECCASRPGQASRLTLCACVLAALQIFTKAHPARSDPVVTSPLVATPVAAKPTSTPTASTTAGAAAVDGDAGGDGNTLASAQAVAGGGAGGGAGAGAAGGDGQGSSDVQGLRRRSNATIDVDFSVALKHPSFGVVAQESEGARRRSGWLNMGDDGDRTDVVATPTPTAPTEGSSSVADVAASGAAVHPSPTRQDSTDALWGAASPVAKHSKTASTTAAPAPAPMPAEPPTPPPVSAPTPAATGAGGGAGASGAAAGATSTTAGAGAVELGFKVVEVDEDVRRLHRK